MKHLEQAFGSDNKWWKYILLFIIVFIAMNFIGAIPIGIVVAIKALKTGDVSMPNPDNYADFSAFGIDPNFGFALMLSPFIIGLVLFWLIIKPMHKRKMLQVVTGASHFRWNRVFFQPLSGHWL
jgi:membrane associated rhomboid family serine protease